MIANVGFVERGRERNNYISEHSQLAQKECDSTYYLVLIFVYTFFDFHSVARWDAKVHNIASSFIFC